jgi:hypothetical protein
MIQPNYEPSGPRGGGPCANCTKSKRIHAGPHQFCPVIVVGPRRAKIGPGEYEITCPVCQKVHKRDLWSLAHMHVEQVMTCDGCNTQLEVPRC